MSAAPTITMTPSISSEAFDSLAQLQRLTLELGLSTDRQQLIFRMLNLSVRYGHYDRAVLWSLQTRQPTILGISGLGDVDRTGPIVERWKTLVNAIDDSTRTHILSATTFETQRTLWAELAAHTHGLTVLWLPIRVDGRVVAAVWLERWGSTDFSDNDIARFESLALAYAIAWRSVTGRPHWSKRFLHTLGRDRTLFFVTVAVVALVLLFPTPLRVVAPCEVVPDRPTAITAPLAGVIDEIVVEPGQTVAPGQLLAVYDKRVATEELNVARQQVQIIESDLQRSRAEAFEKPAARAALTLLENRLLQERVRLDAAQQRINKLELRATVAGIAAFDDPNAWQGRPVQVGERLMLIVQPGDTRVRVWLPESDNIEFRRDKPIRIILDSDPQTSRNASLDFVSLESRITSTGLAAFRAEAHWLSKNAASLKPGLRGSAVLYGHRVPLAWWMLRKPIAALRRATGF